MIFAIILMSVTVFTGIITFLDYVYFKKKRLKKAKEHFLIEYSKSFFPVLLIVFVIRSFIVEPFKIPSGSMMPTLISGDFIAVNKFAYGIRFPVWNKTLINLGSPNRGDVFVFHYPKNPSIDYIKRVVGLPGDEIKYVNKELIINGQSIELKFKDKYNYETNDGQIMSALEFEELLVDSSHSILTHDIPSENYQFNVPEGHYLAMGDNRDNSSDSRAWGFVPEHLLVGKAFIIWLNLSEPGRIGNWIY
jgi:signal peptidase I|tara:strand:- start:788 stop:1531 length:744 start_codon:yes stop_codon:yes gene_type:complete